MIFFSNDSSNKNLESEFKKGLLEMLLSQNCGIALGKGPWLLLRTLAPHLYSLVKRKNRLVYQELQNGTRMMDQIFNRRNYLLIDWSTRSSSSAQG
jgi:hypothetical protein